MPAALPIWHNEDVVARAKQLVQTFIFIFVVQQQWFCSSNVRVDKAWIHVTVPTTLVELCAC